VHHHLSSPEAGVVSAMQAASELFEVSSAGHCVLFPAGIGGSWARDLNVDTLESPYFSLR
jgi:undecaprenyl-diphosphatase